MKYLLVVSFNLLVVGCGASEKEIDIHKDAELAFANMEKELPGLECAWTEALEDWQKDKGDTGNLKVARKKLIFYHDYLKVLHDSAMRLSFKNKAEEIDGKIANLGPVKRCLDSVEIVRVGIHAKAGWVGTGIIVSPNHLVEIYIVGIDTNKGWDCGEVPVGLNPPDAIDTRISKDYKFAALVWTVKDSNSYLPISSDDFTINFNHNKNERILFPTPPPAAGEILLSINDKNLNDNSGMIEVTIVVYLK
jgi:hypothetical protein